MLCYVLSLKFQLLLCFVACERNEALNKMQALGSPSGHKSNQFAKKTIPSESRPVSEMLSELLKAINVDKLTATKEMELMKEGNKNPLKNIVNGGDGSDSVFAGTVAMPAFDGLDNPSNSGANKQSSARQAMLMRIDYLFENDVDNKLQKSTLASPSDLAEMLRPEVNLGDEKGKTRNLLNKPVVIGDAIPVPSNSSTGSIHESVEQMLQAALAHHNLGNYEESLKFLEASRVQLLSVERVALIKFKQKELEKQREYELDQEAADSTIMQKSAVTVTLEQIENVTATDDEVILPIHLEMYIILCKGTHAVTVYHYVCCVKWSQCIHTFWSL